MPNHVTSRVVITGPAQDIQKFRHTHVVSRVHNGETYVLLDFNTVIPMPAQLREIVEGGAAEMGLELVIWRGSSSPPFADQISLMANHYQAYRKASGMLGQNIRDVAAAYLAANPDVEAAGLARLRALAETGYVSWYPWSLQHWGTKWNSYSFSIVAEEPLTIRFDTAWAFPIPVFQRLAELHPTLSFSVACVDEGSNFAGQGAFNPADGETAFRLVDASDELYERVHGHPPPTYDDDEAVAL